MDKRRISVNVQSQILILRDKNYGIRRISKSLNIARNTVRDFLRAYDGASEAESTDSVSEIKSSTDSDSKINWNEVHLNFNKGVPIKTQWQELCFNCDVSYSSFYLTDFTEMHHLIASACTTRLHEHVPGNFM